MVSRGGKELKSNLWCQWQIFVFIQSISN